MPKIKPLNDRVLVERLEASEKTAGGILLPDSAKEKPTQGKIVATGDGRRTEKGDRLALSVSVGDTILFSSYAGTAIKEGGHEYLILDEGEILAIVDSKPFPKAKKPSTKKKSK
ncbi:MAG: co-chaperone GroES [Planctomycetota bacterium]|nr:co-chaperone GroES [Planctomycetota bacterium]